MKFTSLTEATNLKDKKQKMVSEKQPLASNEPKREIQDLIAPSCWCQEFSLGFEVSKRAAISTYAILGVPYYKYFTIYPKIYSNF